MRSLPAALAAVALSFLMAGAARAQDAQTFTSLAGPWWFTIGGKDKGAIVLEFSEPASGAFTVTDVELTGNPSFGFSRELADFFQIAADQELELDANRNIVGDLTLDLDGGGTATLSIEKGKPDKTFTTMKLRATLNGVKVKLKGVRPPDAFPVLTGRTTDGTLKGKGVKSKAMDLSVETSPDFGAPAYHWTAAGPTQTPDGADEASLEGRVMLLPSFKVWGLLDDSDFGDGLINGKLRVPDPNNPVPKFGIAAKTTDPKITVKGSLTQAVEPVLSVTPLSFDFGGVRLDDPNGGATKTFLVQNVGVDELSGTIEFLSGSDVIDFSVDPNSFGPLTPDSEPEQIVVTFDPQTTGAKSARLRFGVEGGPGSVVVPLTGTGGVAELSVDPDPIDFPDTSISAATPALVTVTVTNDGDGSITGQATIENQSPIGTFFTLRDTLDVPRTAIQYTLAPGENVRFKIAFDPQAAVDYSAQLGLSGGGPRSVNITGTGTSP